MIKVGITGGIGSGKSTVCRIFQTMHVPVYFADDRAKWLMENDSEVKMKIQASFGKESYTEKGLNRLFLAKKVFSSPSETAKINAIVHPAVGHDFTRWTAKQNAPYVLKEAALMFESDSYKTLNKIICVSAPKSIRIARTLKRDPHRTEQDIEHIMNKQLSEEEKISRSDYVIINDDTQLVIPQVLKIHRNLLSL